MVSRREAAQRLDISLEMAHRHGIPSKISLDELAQIDQNPPPWLAQSRANRTGATPVWVLLKCDVCGETESARPKKWWPAFTYLSCNDHSPDDIPRPTPGLTRDEFDGVGSRFVGIVDSA